MIVLSIVCGKRIAIRRAEEQREEREERDLIMQHANDYGRSFSSLLPFPFPLRRPARGEVREDALSLHRSLCPSNSARIARGSARQRQESAKANIVIGGGTRREWRRTGTEGGTHREDREGVEEA